VLITIETLFAIGFHPDETPTPLSGLENSPIVVSVVMLSSYLASNNMSLIL
jgi:hypothetical protein